MSIQIITPALEQGSITSSGNQNSTRNVRSADYLILNGCALNAVITVQTVNGKSVQVDLLGYEKSTSTSPKFDLYWYDSGHQFDIEKYPEVSYLRVVLKYEDGSDILPSDIAVCEIRIEVRSAWFIDSDGLPSNESFLPFPDDPLAGEIPKMRWRIDSTFNNGLPYHELLPGIRQYKLLQVFQNQYITVHGHRTKYNEFDDNGLAVLQPTSCTITEELNGEYSLQITLPLDDIGKWTYIKEMNYIKAMGQVFRICQVDFSNSGGEQQVSATALHAFYIWNDWAIEPKSFLQIEHTVPGKTSHEYLISGMRRVMYCMNFLPEQGIPKFTYTSDIDDIDIHLAVEKWGHIGSLENVGTATELIMGSDGFIANFGGELYRDNFYFSINRRMEGLYGNSNFNIYIGRDLKGIKRKVDVSTSCTYLKSYDNGGNMFAVSWVHLSAINYCAHPITRRMDFEYDEPSMDRLISDAMNYFNQHCTPLINITIDFEDVMSNSDFREFNNKPIYKVGAIGTIYDEYLGTIIEMKITKTTTDAITGKVKTVSFGASRQAGYNVNTNIVGYDVPLNKSVYKPVRDIRGRQLKTNDGYKMVRKTEV